MIFVVTISSQPILFVVARVAWYFLIGVDLLNVSNGLLDVGRRLAAAVVGGYLSLGGRHVV